MAQIDIKRFERLDKQRNTVQSKVYATYTVFDDNGQRYFQVDSYGKDDRNIPEKSSQIFQLDRDMAKVLVNLLISEFELKLQ